MKKTILVLSILTLISFTSCSENISWKNTSSAEKLDQNYEQQKLTAQPQEKIFQNNFKVPKNGEIPAAIKVQLLEKPPQKVQKKVSLTFKKVTKTTQSAASLPSDALACFGQKSSSVKDIQNKLNFLGYSLVVDGIYGPNTEKALKNFSARVKLSYKGYLSKAMADSINTQYITAKVKHSEKTQKASITKSSEGISTKLLNYLSEIANGQSVANRVSQLHGGNFHNACVYFVSEALRRVNVNIPVSTVNIHAIISELKKRGFTQSYNLEILKPGDICFTTDVKGNKYGRPTHCYIFLGWASTGIANVIDNQIYDYNSIYHQRNLALSYLNGDKNKSKEATSFFMRK